MFEYIDIGADRNNHVLTQEWGGLKSVLAVASGGLSPCHVPELTAIKKWGQKER